MGHLEEPDVRELDMPIVMQALGDRLRLQIVQALAQEGEKQCGTFELGIAKATRSHHFKVLREAGITRTRVDGTSRFISLRADDLNAKFPGLLAAVLGTVRV
ncbi:MAG TPA: helix-turn-helix transcriptional regulator [Aeromicrobium sp.]|nr:helix-turn-helix transcriptional regulator [Aeromicrobium sp.]